MLTEQERKWLEERKKRTQHCDTCPNRVGYYELCSSCRSRSLYGLSLCPDYCDAAEFEARVAARLAGAWAIGEDMCFNNHCQLFDKDRCTACYLKNARIAVEEEMDNDAV